MSKKLIIVFEGIEGTGKTFHINNVANYLKKKKKSLLRLENLVEAQILKKLENLYLVINLHLISIQIYYYIYQLEVKILN